jgi:hypothetical protein
VAAGGGDQDRPLGVVLALDVDEVLLGVGELAEDLVEVDGLGLDVELPGEEADGLGEAGDGEDVEPLDDGGLGGVCGGDEQAANGAAMREAAGEEMPLYEATDACPAATTTRPTSYDSTGPPFSEEALRPTSYDSTGPPFSEEALSHRPSCHSCMIAAPWKEVLIFSGPTIVLSP